MSVLHTKVEGGPNYWWTVLFCTYYKDQKKLWNSACIFCNVNAAFLPGNWHLKKRTGCLAVASWRLLSCAWEHQEVHPLPVSPGDPFLSFGLGPPFLNYVVGVPTTSLSSSLSPALSPGWISDLHCGFVSGPVSCYSWLDCLGRPWTWFITSAHLGLPVELAINPWLCTTSSGAAELCPNWWRYCPACAVVTPCLPALWSKAVLLLSSSFVTGLQDEVLIRQDAS